MIEALLTLALALYCAKNAAELVERAAPPLLAKWAEWRRSRKRYAIRLEGFRDETKIPVIEAFRDATGLGLKDAKEAIADRHPSPWLATDLTIDAAKRLAVQLGSAGARVAVLPVAEVPDGVTVCADRYKVREDAP